jgi:fermentation-respiration switch protein FrsA (DUF1100 family)
MATDRRRERLTIENDRGLRLAARLDLPTEGEPHAGAVIAHCFTCSKDVRALRLIAERLADAGMAVLRLDFTGLGASEGDFEETTFSSSVDDLLAGVAAVRERVTGKVLLVGHSLGGSAALAAALRDEAVAAVATVGAPASPEHVMRALAGELDTIEREGAAEVDIGGRPFTVGKALVDDLRDAELPSAVRALRRPLLILHAPDDRAVGVGQALELFEAARQPKGFVALDGANHLPSDPVDARYAGELIATWAARYLEG